MAGVPLLAFAVMEIGTVPEAPGAHCTVTVSGPVETMFATVVGGVTGLITLNCAE